MKQPLAVSARAENAPADWLALHRAPGVGPITFAKLLGHFQSPRGVLTAGLSAWQAVRIQGELLRYLQNPDWAAVEQDLAWLAQPQHHLLTWADPGYPAHLREIHDPPPLLFVQGDPTLLAATQLAMVGSRNPSRSGEETAFGFARYLAQMGWVITSGLAFGIDAASHRGALAATGKTVAVTGTGLDRVYPAKHRTLAQQISERGALVSELVPGTPVRSAHFPRRNRIISGLSVGTLVVEATLRSGSLITARLAGEQGREVFAIPGSIHNPLVKGCHALIKEGAKLVEAAEDILVELASVAPRPLSGDPPPGHPSVSAVQGQTLDPEYQQLFERMGIDEPVSIDDLVEDCGLTAEAVSSMLLILELRGLVASHSGGCYVKLGQRIEDK